MITAFLVDGNLKYPHGLLHADSPTPLSRTTLLLISNSSATLNFSTQFLARY